MWDASLGLWLLLEPQLAAKAAMLTGGSGQSSSADLQAPINGLSPEVTREGKGYLLCWPCPLTSKGLIFWVGLILGLPPKIGLGLLFE